MLRINQYGFYLGKYILIHIKLVQKLELNTNRNRISQSKMHYGNNKSMVKTYSAQGIHNKENFQLSRFYSDLERIESSLHTSKSKTKVSRNNSQNSISRPNTNNASSLGHTTIKNMYNSNTKPSINSNLKKQNFGTKYAFEKYDKNRLNLQERSSNKLFQPFIDRNTNSQIKFSNQEQKSQNNYSNKFDKSVKACNITQKKKLFDSQATSKFGEQDQGSEFQQTHLMTKNEFSKSKQYSHSYSCNENWQKQYELKKKLYQTHQGDFRVSQKQQERDNSQQGYDKIQKNQNQTRIYENDKEVTAKIMNEISLRDDIYETVVQGMKKVYQDEGRDKRQDFRLKQALEQQEELSYVFQRERLLSKMVDQFKKMCGIEKYNLNQLHSFLFQGKQKGHTVNFQGNQSRTKSNFTQSQDHVLI